jgi:hypothetical protein
VDYTGSGGGGGTDSGTSGGNGGSGIVIVRYLASPDAPAIQNQPVTDVTTGSATFNGTLTSTGGSACAVCVLWGEQNGGQTWNWAKTNWFAGTGWTNNNPFSTNITAGIAANKTYYYTFGASNATANAVASGPKSFITGEVTVDLTDGTAQYPYDTGTFTIRRPATCTNAALTVTYTMSGTATTPTHYTLDYSSSVTMNAGVTSAVVTLTPTFASVGTAILTLTASNTYNYPVGTPNSATVTILQWVPGQMSAVGGTITNYAAGGTNWTAHIFTTVGDTNIEVTAGGFVDVLIVGGGGGGGNGGAGDHNGGGGGAGGLRYFSNLAVTQGQYTVRIGDGGAPDLPGADSSFGTNTATGGGKGGGGGTDGGNGGSGGGGRGWYSGPGSGNIPSTSPSQGNNGGNGSTLEYGYGSGGGGGAGHIGYDGSGSGSGNGGEGVAYDISGSTNYYAGGGGGGVGTGTIGSGGSSIGGNGGSGGGAGSDAVDCTGSGGGGGTDSGTSGGNGGSGIVIIRYKKILPPQGTVFAVR